MDEPSDEQTWIEHSRQGDHAAFEKLIQKYQHMAHVLTYRMTGSLEEAEDLAQETFIQVYHSLRDFRGDSQFSSWLYRIALNLCLNWQKRNQRRDRAHQQWAEQAQGQSNNRTWAEPLQEALLKLHPKQRAAIVLTICEGLNHAEAARVLGCSETTVSWRVFAARNKLRHLLKNDQSGL